MKIQFDTTILALPESIREQFKDGNVFFSEAYGAYSLRKGGQPIYFYSEDYAIVTFIHKKLIFKYAIMPTEYMSISDAAGNGTEFLDQVIQILKKKFGIHWVGPSQATALFDKAPSDAIKIPFGSHVSELSQTEEELWKHVHSKHRNVIRRAEKEGVTIKKGGRELLEDYLKMDMETWDRSNKQSNGAGFYEDFLSISEENAIIYIAYKENEPQGGAIYLYNKAMSYYMFGASINRPETGSMNLLQWKAMLDMKEQNVQKFSFVGCRIDEDPDSKYHGIQRFKERFGGELIQGYMFKVICNPLMYKLFTRLTYIKNNKGHAYAIDPIDQEIHKWEGKL